MIECRFDGVFPGSPPMKSLCSKLLVVLALATGLFQSAHAGRAPYRITNARSGLSLGISGSSQVSGAALVQETWTSGTSQQWELIDRGTNRYVVRNANSGEVVGIPGNSVADGAASVQSPENVSTPQLWSVEWTGTGYFKLRNGWSGKLLQVTSTAAGAAAVQAAESGSSGQLWGFERVVSGSIPVQGAGIYSVAPWGSDFNPGTLALPFRTLAKVSGTLQAGQTCYLRKGIYRETLNASRSGSSNAPIVFQAYPGEDVIISGLDPLRGWTQYQGFIYRIPVTLSLGDENAVLFNGKLMDLARWPNNSDGNPFTPDTLPSQAGSLTYVRHSSIPSIDWTGGVLWYLGTNRWTSWRTRITSSDSVLHQVNFTLPNNGWEYSQHNPANGGDFYLMDKLEVLDAPGEWYYDKAAAMLYFQAPGNVSPDAGLVEVRRRTTAINLVNRSYIQVKGINCLGGAVNLYGTTACLVQDARLKMGTHDISSDSAAFPDGKSVYLAGNNDVVERSEISYGSDYGLMISGSGNIIRQNRIHDIDWNGSYGSPISLNGTANTVTQCEIFNAGRDCIGWGAQASDISYNDVHHSTLICEDAGLIYTVSKQLQWSRIHHNEFHDAACRGSSRVVGVYLDNASQYCIVDHNVVHDIAGVGVQINSGGAYLNVYNNTIWNNQTVMGGSLAAPGRTDVKVYNNLANAAVWVGAEFMTNLATAEVPFVDLTTDDFRLLPGSAPVDAGTVIPGYTDGFSGSAPDVGALEIGADWTAGVGDILSDIVWQQPEISATPGDAQMALYWTPVNGAITYSVKRSLTSGSGYAVVGSSTNGTAFTDTGLVNGANYFYTVIAVTADGQTFDFPEIAAIPLPPQGNGAWTSAAAGFWSGGANWQSLVVAGGTDSTATFAQATGVTVTQDITGLCVGGFQFSNGNYTVQGSDIALATTSGTSTFNVSSGVTATFAAALTGSNAVFKTGSGTLVLSASNAYTGTTLIGQGTLTIGNGSALRNTLVQYNGGTLNRNTSDSTAIYLGGLSSTNGAVTLSLGNAAWTIGGNHASTLFAGKLTGNGNLIKTGSGALTLTGNSAFTGIMTVSSGTLIVDTTATLSSGTVSIANGAVCELRNSNGLAASTSVSLNGSAKLVLAPNVTGSVSKLFIDGLLQYSGTYQAGADPAHFAGSGSLLASAGAPAAPTGLTATMLSASSIALSWADNSSSETGYSVERSTVSGAGYVQVATLAVSATNYIDTGLTGNSTYYYRVNALLNGPTVAYSNEATALTVPSAPVGFTVFRGNQQAILWWTAIAGVTNYKVQRSVTSGNGYTVAGTPTGATFTDTGLTNGVTYYYIVSAVNAAGESVSSTEASATPSASGDGIWSSVVNGNWSVAGNWLGYVVPSGTNVTATFNAATGVSVTQNVAGLTLGNFQFATSNNSFVSGSIALASTSGTSIFNVDSTSTTTFYTLLTGSSVLAKAGTGTLVLSSSNSYSGGTTISAGALRVAHNAALGASASTITVSNVGRLELTGTVTVTGKSISLAGTGGDNWLAGALRCVTGSCKWDGGVVIAEAGTRIGANPALGPSGTLEVSGVISGSAVNNVLFTPKTGYVILSGSNTYLGQTTIYGSRTIDSVTVTSIRNTGEACSLGAPTIASNAVIQLGSYSAPSYLRYIGTGNVSNRPINLALTTGTAILEQSGSGLLKFTSDFTASGTGNKILVLTGTTAGTGEIAGAIVDNSVSGVTSVTKNGTGTWTLSGVSTYTGETAVDAGTLIFDTAGVTASGTLSVANGAVCELRNPTGAIPDSAWIMLSGSGKLTLNGVTETVSRVYVDGVLLETGAWNAVRDPVHFSGSGNVIVTDGMQVPTAIETWRQLYFGSIANTGTGADSADPDHDGVPNLAEFALGLNPNTPNAFSAFLVRNGANVEYTYCRSTTAVAYGVVYTVEFSDTLAPGSWSSSGVDQQSSLADNGAVQTVKALVPAEGTTRRFIRINIVNP